MDGQNKKTLAQLRETFVQIRFIHSFVSVNMDAWVASLSRLEDEYTQPPDDEVLVQLMEDDVLELKDPDEAREIMCECGTLLSSSFDNLPGQAWEDFSHFAEHAGKGADAFFGAREFVVMEFPDRDRPCAFMFMLKNSKTIVLKPFGKKDEIHVTSRCVADVLLAEWKHKRPNWKAARSVLVTAIERKVQTVREQAIHEFDSASAIDELGTRVQEASYVVVPNPSKGPKAILVFPGTAFKSRRVRLGKVTTTQRVKHLKLGREGEEATESVTDVLSFLLGNGADLVHYKNQVLLLDTHEREPVLFTPLNFCPDPLPDGGVEV